MPSQKGFWKQMWDDTVDDVVGGSKALLKSAIIGGVIFAVIGGAGGFYLFGTEGLMYGVGGGFVVGFVLGAVFYLWDWSAF